MMRRHSAVKSQHSVIFSYTWPHTWLHTCLCTGPCLYPSIGIRTSCLHADLPLVTRAGSGWCSRVAASVLLAHGMAELIGRTDAEYDELVQTLMTHERRRRAVKEKMAAARGSSPLFDSRRWVRGWEQSLEILVDTTLSGTRPPHVIVADRHR